MLKKFKNNKIILVIVSILLLIMLSSTSFLEIIPQIQTNKGIIQLNTLFKFDQRQIYIFVGILIFIATTFTLLLLYNFLDVTYKILKINISEIKLTLYSFVILFLNVATNLFINSNIVYWKLIPLLISFLMYLEILFHDLRNNQQKISLKICMIIFVYFLIFVISNFVLLIIPK